MQKLKGLIKSNSLALAAVLGLGVATISVFAAVDAFNTSGANEQTQVPGQSLEPSTTDLPLCPSPSADSGEAPSGPYGPGDSACDATGFGTYVDITKAPPPTPPTVSGE